MTTTTHTPAGHADRVIASTILGQIGRWDKVTLAIRDLVAIDQGLQATVGARHNIRKVRVVLNARDLYTVTFYRKPRRSIDWVETACLDDIDAENLGPVLVRLLDGEGRA